MKNYFLIILILCSLCNLSIMTLTYFQKKDIHFWTPRIPEFFINGKKIDIELEKEAGKNKWHHIAIVWKILTD